MDGNESDRWVQLWRAVREPATWFLGAGLLVQDALLRHGQDGVLVTACIGLIGGSAVIRRVIKDLSDE